MAACRARLRRDATVAAQARAASDDRVALAALGDETLNKYAERVLGKLAAHPVHEGGGKHTPLPMRRTAHERIAQDALVPTLRGEPLRASVHRCSDVEGVLCR